MKVVSTHIWSFTTRNFKELSLQKTTQCMGSLPFRMFLYFLQCPATLSFLPPNPFPYGRKPSILEPNFTPPSLEDQAGTTLLPKKRHSNLAWSVSSSQDICCTMTSQPFFDTHVMSFVPAWDTYSRVRPNSIVRAFT